jgi:hypothetical protein
MRCRKFSFKEISMSFSNTKPSPKPDIHAVRLSSRFAAAALLIAGLASANAGAGVLEKLLAPAVGTKPGFSEGKKTYDEDTLKPDELKTCIINAHDIDERAATQAADSAALTKERDQLLQFGATVKAAVEESKKRSLTPEESAKLNADIATYQKQETDFNAHAREANSKGPEYAKQRNAAIDAFSDLCNGKHFYKSDLNAVRPSLPFDITPILEGKK